MTDMSYRQGPDAGRDPPGVGGYTSRNGPGGPHEDGACRGGRDHSLRVARELARDVLTCSACKSVWARPTAKLNANREIVRTSGSYVVLRRPLSDRRLAQDDATRSAAVLRAARAAIDRANEDLPFWRHRTLEEVPDPRAAARRTKAEENADEAPRPNPYVLPCRRTLTTPEDFARARFGRL